MAAPIVVNLGGPRSLVPRARPLPREDMLSQLLAEKERAKRDDDQMLALLLSILLQQKRDTTQDDQFKAQLAQQSEQFGQQFDLSRQQLDESIEASRQIRTQTQAEIDRSVFQEGLGREAQKFARAGERPLELLGITADENALNVEEAIERGQRAMLPALRRINRSLKVLRKGDEPDRKQIDEIIEAFRSAKSTALSRLDEGGVLGIGGVQPGEIAGALGGEYLVLARELEDLMGDADDRLNRELTPLLTEVQRDADIIGPIVASLATLETRAFGRERTSRRRSALESEVELARLRDEAERSFLGGTPAADAIRLLSEQTPSLDVDRFQPPSIVSAEELSEILGTLAPRIEDDGRQSVKALGEELLGPGVDLHPKARKRLAGVIERETKEDEKQRRMTERFDEIDQIFKLNQALDARDPPGFFARALGGFTQTPATAELIAPAARRAVPAATGLPDLGDIALPVEPQQQEQMLPDLLEDILRRIREEQGRRLELSPFDPFGPAGLP